MAFKKPLDLEQQRLAREKELARAVTHDHVLRRAVSLCNELRRHLSSQEKSVVVHCQYRLGCGLSPSIAQERWLLDIERMLRARLEAKVSALASRYADGEHEGEHPSYPRADWPDLNSEAVPPSDYWFWVLRLVESEVA